MTDQTEWLDKAMEMAADYGRAEFQRATRKAAPSDYEPTLSALRAHLSLRAAPQDVAELVGYQFRYVFHDQDNRRSDWTSVMPPPRRIQNGRQMLQSDTWHFEVRDVFGGPVGGGAPVIATPPDREALRLAKDALENALPYGGHQPELRHHAALAAINAALEKP